MPLNRSSLIFALVLVLGACSRSFPPSDSPPTPAPKGDTIPRVGVCYNKMTAKPQQLVTLAKESCGPGLEPRFHDEKYSLETCPLATPVRITYQCLPPGP